MYDTIQQTARLPKKRGGYPVAFTTKKLRERSSHVGLLLSMKSRASWNSGLVQNISIHGEGNMPFLSILVNYPVAPSSGSVGVLAWAVFMRADEECGDTIWVEACYTRTEA
eukprot:scaffold832_cov403-Prasinococcus_capsulatus_cf.AAC.5